MQHLLIKTKGSKERFTKTNDIPEFQRITRKFADYINHIDEWLKEE